MVTGRRILLLADDSPATQKIVSATFADEEFEVIAVGDGSEAARRLDEGLVPDIVLADVLMPGLTGYELCERIKGDRRLAHVPVMLLVGTFEPYNEAEARRVGAETVVTKPFKSLRGLVSKVGSLMGGSKSGEEATRPAPPPPHEAAPSQPPEEPQHEPSQEAAPPPQDASASFADLRMDDEMIEARTADAYAQEKTQPDPLETQEMETVRVVNTDAGHDAFAETLRDPMFAAAAPRHDADERSDAQVYAQRPAPFAPSHVAEEARAPLPAFAARVGVGSAATDDALLDLDLDAPAAPAADDDFILDLDDEPAPLAAREAAPAPDAAGAFAEAAHGETVFDESAAAWPSQGGEVQSREVAAEVVAQDEPLGFVGGDASGEQQFGDVQDFGSHTAREMLSATVADEMIASPVEVSDETSHEVSDAARSFVEPEVVPAAEAPHPAGVAEFTDGSVEGDVARPPASGFVAAPVEAETVSPVESAPVEPVVESAPVVESSAAQESPFPPVPSTAGYEMGAARVGVEEGLRPEQLSPEMIDAIARRVVELMSDKVVREIAWEVVPDLAELLIKQKLEEDRRQ